MKKRIKNKELEGILESAAQLGSYAMPGDLTLAIIGARKKMKTAYESYIEASKQIGEARCEKDAGGKPLTTYQLDVNGEALIHQPKKIKFKDAVTEAAALEELRRLGEQEVELDVQEFDASAIHALQNITPIQMEAITSLIQVKTLQPENNNAHAASANGMY